MPSTPKPIKASSVRFALNLLVKWYTGRRDWFMVQRLLNDLGKLEEEKKS